MSVAESITGGMIASTLIDIAGASECIHESFITYSAEAKQKYLRVAPEIIEQYTEVSKECARAMAEGLAKQTNSDLCIATTGYAGPTGNPVGEVYIGICYHGKTRVWKHQLQGDRWMIRNRTRALAIDYALLETRETV